MRFPGLYIPPIPNKQSGAKEAETVRERQYFLDAFVKELSSLKYLAQSKEVQIFLRPQGDLEKALSKLYKPQTQEILSTYRATLPVAEVSNYQSILSVSKLSIHIDTIVYLVGLPRQRH